jgi:hypothetical protein
VGQYEKDILMDALYPTQRWNPERKFERPVVSSTGYDFGEVLD